MSIELFTTKKINKEKIVMITCYDYPFAQIINETSVDAVLVGDSVAMAVHGHTSTLTATIEMMDLHTQAVARGCKKFIVADLPFLSYRKSLSENMFAVEKLMKAGAHAVKLEGADDNLEFIKHLTLSGVPVMGHLGLTPQSTHQLGGFKVQGRDEKSHNKILSDALALQEVGCFSVVLECIPKTLAYQVTQSLQISTIGIGASAATDGQILVLQDMLGFNPTFNPKFLKKYDSAFSQFVKSVENYSTEVKSNQFPSEKNEYL